MLAQPFRSTVGWCPVLREPAPPTLPAGEAYTVELRRRYDASVEDVWDALTSPERLARWMKPVTGDLPRRGLRGGGW